MTETKRSDLISIIIPYYQTEPGILRKCLRSVLATGENIAFEAIVVDDASPVPAEHECRDLPMGWEKSIRIIHQANGGPAAARNTGIDHVRKETRYITFLDSDDEWTGPFLSDAVSALDRGYELFIGNSTRAGVNGTRFDWGSSPARNLVSAGHQLIDSERDIYEFRGDFFDLIVHRSNIIGPTSMAYGLERFPTLRFRESLYQGEDRLFKLAMARKLRSIAFSPKIYAHEGEGINIFAKSAWSSEGSLRLNSSYISLSKAVLQEIPLTPTQRSFVQQQLSDSRSSFIASLLHLFKKRSRIDWKLVGSTFKNDPWSVATLVPNLLRISRRRMTARR